MAPDYILQQAEKTRCLACDRKVELLCPRTASFKGKWFYICWPCQAVYQIGKGQVIRV